MRYYNIVLTNSTTGAQILPASLQGLPLSSLLPNGQVNTSALNIELDLPVGPMHAPIGQGIVKIWGISLAEIGSTYNLNDNLISVYAGMSKGLPLANPSQARLLIKGTIFQAFGNWQGTEQSIDLIFYPDGGTNADPKNFALNWQAGTPLATALSGALTTGLPNAKQQINLSPRLTLNYAVQGVYGTLNNLSTWANSFSQSIITDANYPGVTITYDGTTVKVTDQTTPPPNVTAIEFTDLLGQPTWIGSQTIQFKTVMRGDINLQDVVSLPQGPTIVTAASLSRFLNIQDKTSFTGNYVVQEIHHYGNFRQPDGASWNTTFNARPQTTAEAPNPTPGGLLGRA